MKSLILALAVLAVAPAHAAKLNVMKCQSVLRGYDVGTTVHVKYDLEAKLYEITVSEMWIGGVRTTTENAVQRMAPAVVGAPKVYESKSFVLRANFTVSPSAKSNGSLVAKDRGGQGQALKCGLLR